MMTNSMLIQKKTKSNSKLIAIVLSILLLFAMMSITASTVYGEDGEIIAGGNYEGVNWKLSSDGTLSIGSAAGIQTLDAIVDRNEDSWPWHSYVKDIRNVEIVGQINAQGSLHGMFHNMYNASSIKGLPLVNTTEATSFRGMFYNDIKLEEIDVSGFDTSNATDIAGLFNNCVALKSIDLCEFRTENVTNMTNMFLKCRSLKEIDLSSLDTQKVTYMYSIFDGCTQLTKIVLGDKFQVLPAQFYPAFPKNTDSTNRVFANADKDYIQQAGSLTDTTLGAYAGTWLAVATISFDSNGGEGSMEDQNVCYSETSKLKANGFTKEGMRLKGWADEDGTILFSDEEEVDFAKLVDKGMTEDKITLYAKWVCESHDFVTEVTKEATCEENGTKVYTCTVCGEKETEEIPAIGHNWEAWNITKKASTTADGSKTRACFNDSGHNETVVIPKFSIDKPKTTTVGSSKKKSFVTSWNKVKGATDYSVCYKKARSKQWTAKNVTDTKFVLKNVKNSSLYNFKVRANRKETDTTVAASSKYSSVINRYMKAVKKVTGKAGKKKMTIKWKKDKKSNGYQIKYSSKKKGTELVKPKTITLKGKNKTKKTIAKLKKGKRYYVRVLPFKKYKGTRYYGVMSLIISVKVK